MEVADVKDGLIICLKTLIEKDQFLLVHDVSERSISHRLGVYLSQYFKGLDVDCEYNSNVEADNGKKYIVLLKERARELGLLKQDEVDQELIYRAVFPDIIVHKRGRNGSTNNTLIVEIKKSSSNSRHDYDREKLRAYTSSHDENRLKYLIGAFVCIGVGKKNNGYSLEWYCNGSKV
jgi:DNA-binding transcriptional regulator WhiA